MNYHVKFLRLVMVFTVISGMLLPIGGKLSHAAPPQFDPNHVLCNNDFVTDSPVGKDQVQQLLDKADTDLKDYRDPANNKLASEIIAEAINRYTIKGGYRINPNLILVKMDVESSTVWGKNRHDLQARLTVRGQVVGTRVDWILFYGWPDDPTRIDLTKKGFTNQVNNAVRILVSDFADLAEDGKGRNNWAIGVPRNVDGTTVTPANAATAALYIYTPHIYNDKVNIHAVWVQRIGDTGCNDSIGMPGQPPAAPASTSTILVMDVSGSMGDMWKGGVKIESAKSAATDILNMIEHESQVGGVPHQVAIVAFTTDAWLELGLTTDYAQARSVISGLQALDRTNIGAAIQVANDELRNAPPEAKPIMILLSDGMTNEGLSPEEILSGPVQDAADAGTCIYTVGFGDPGDLDEDLLRRIAEATGCEYYYAPDAYQLENVYIRLRHESTGTVIGEFSGQVGQGETATIGEVTVPPNQGELHVTLNWPGSKLDLILTDPNGRKVDQNYPGVTISEFANLTYVIIANPLPGLWLASVFGREVLEGIINWHAIFSTQEAVIPPPPTISPAVLMLLVTLVLGVIAVFFIAVVSRPLPRPTPGGVRVVQGYGPGGFVGFRRGVITIGRDPRSELVLWDNKVSRYHAQIRMERGWPVIYDLRSTNGTFVNGQRITSQMLREGDRIRVGGTELVFQSQMTPSHHQATAGQAELVVQAGATPGLRYPLSKPVITLGRHPRNDVALPGDVQVSNWHAEIRQEAGWFVIYDLGSTNGTFVNGQRVTRQVLRPGDRIRVGDTELVFHSPAIQPYRR